MSNLLAIASHLESQGLGTQGSTLFVNFMPYECKRGILLRTPLTGTEINHELPGYYKCEVIVMVRAPEYVSALTLMENTMRALTLYERQMGNIYVKHIRPITLPVSFPVSEGQFYEVQVRFETVYIGVSYGHAP